MRGAVVAVRPRRVVRREGDHLVRTCAVYRCRGDRVGARNGKAVVKSTARREARRALHDRERVSSSGLALICVRDPDRVAGCDGDGGVVAHRAA